MRAREALRLRKGDRVVVATEFTSGEWVNGRVAGTPRQERDGSVSVPLEYEGIKEEILHTAIHPR